MLFKVTAYFMLLVTAEDLILSIQEEEEKTLKFFSPEAPYSTLGNPVLLIIPAAELVKVQGKISP